MTKSNRRAMRAVRAMLFHRDLVSLGCPRSKAAVLTARRYRLSAATISRYVSRTRGVPQRLWIRALWPAFKGRTARAPMSRHAWLALLSSYLRPERLARRELRQCIARLRAVGKVRGWKIPSTKTLARRINELLQKGPRIPRSQP